MMNIAEIMKGGVEWIDLAQDKENSRALMKAVMIIRAP
jgi:hypothetical protein